MSGPRLSRLCLSWRPRPVHAPETGRSVAEPSPPHEPSLDTSIWPEQLTMGTHVGCPSPPRTSSRKTTRQTGQADRLKVPSVQRKPFGDRFPRHPGQQHSSSTSEPGGCRHADQGGSFEFPSASPAVPTLSRTPKNCPCLRPPAKSYVNLFQQLCAIYSVEINLSTGLNFWK